MTESVRKLWYELTPPPSLLEKIYLFDNPNNPNQNSNQGNSSSSSSSEKKDDENNSKCSKCSIQAKHSFDPEDGTAIIYLCDTHYEEFIKCQECKTNNCLTSEGKIRLRPKADGS